MISRPQEEDVNLSVACALADAMHIRQEQPYQRVTGMSPERAEWLKNARMLMGPVAFATTEHVVRSLFEAFEGTRRIYALRESIYRFTSAATIAHYKDSGKDCNPGLETWQKYYGISEDPKNFLTIPDKLAWKNPHPIMVADSTDMLENFMWVKKAKKEDEIEGIHCQTQKPS